MPKRVLVPELNDDAKPSSKQGKLTSFFRPKTDETGGSSVTQEVPLDLKKPEAKQQTMQSFFRPKDPVPVVQAGVAVPSPTSSTAEMLTALSGPMTTLAAAPGAKMHVKATDIEVTIESPAPCAQTSDIPDGKKKGLQILPPKWRRPVGKYQTEPKKANGYKSQIVYWNGKKLEPACIGECCIKKPKFGLQTDNGPSHCKGCKTAEMVDIVSPHCPCGKQPKFGLPTDARPSCCKDCKTAEMVDIVHPRCPCGKQPSFGLETDAHPSCCKDCKTVEMVDITNPRCPCGKRPVFGLEMDARPSCCKDCKTAEMVDITNPRCPCGKRPSFGLETDARPSCCKDCKTAGMVDIVSPRCPCGKHPSFGLETDARPSCCKDCKTAEMVDIVSPRCPCGKLPSFGLETDARPSCCKDCKTAEMVNIACARCHEAGCEHQAQIKSESGAHYCVTCAGKHGLVAVSKSGSSIEASECLDVIEREVFDGKLIPYRDRLLPDKSWERKEKYGLLSEHSRLHPDGYVPPPDQSPSSFKGTIIEYHGDYYHGSPPWHEAHESNVFGGQWGPDLYRATMERMQLFKDSGFRVLYIWGSDWKRVQANKAALKDMLREL